MATESNYNGVTIERSWSLMAFAQENGLPKHQTYTNADGEQFETLCFPGNGGSRIFCHFGRSTAGMSIAEIIKQKDNLRVGLNSNGNYTLYNDGLSGEVIRLF